MNKRGNLVSLLLSVMVLLCMLSMSAFADGEDDNSLYSLGILTEGAQVSPEFEYSRAEYDVTVPAGTEKLELEPITSNGSASIIDLSGMELSDGKATVSITVEAQNGAQFTYVLYVTAEEGAVEPAAAPIEPLVIETEPQTEAETEEPEPETEDPRYVKVDRESLEETQIVVENLKAETTNYRERVAILTKILYGMIGFCVVLLFIVINLLLKKRELKNELKAYRGYGYDQMPVENYVNGQDYNGMAYDSNYQSAGYDNGYYPQDNYTNASYDQNGYANGQQDAYGYYEQPAYDNVQAAPQPSVKEKKRAAKPRKAKKMKDDPTTVPKPEDARIQAKEMPAYQPPSQPTEYQQPANGQESQSGIEVNMIDL